MSDERLTECPLRTLLRARESQPALSAELDRYLTTLYPMYADGHLLVAGGVADQPNRYLEFMLAIRSTEAVVQRKYDKVNAAEQETE